MSGDQITRLKNALKAADAAGNTGDATALAKALRTAMQAPADSRPDSNMLEGVVDSLTQGIAFGFGDEMTAFESAVLGKTPEGGVFDYSKPYGERYDQALTAERQQQKRFADESPVIATGSEIVGGIAGALATGGAGLVAKGATIQGKAALGALEGAGYGGLYGFGSGEGGAANRAKNAAVGGVTGAALGGTLAAAGTKFGQAIANYRANKAAAASGASPNASQMLARGIEAEGPDAVVERIRAGGPDAMLVDGGQALSNQLDTAANGSVMGATRAMQQVDERAAATNQRMTSALDDTFGAPRGLNQTARDIASSTRPARQQGYDAAYASPIDYGTGAPGERILTVLKRVSPRLMKDAVDEANEAMQSVYGARQYPHILAEVGEGGAPVFKELPNVQQLDEIKKALQKIGQEVDGLRRPTGPANRANALARDLRDAISDAAPAYSDAIAAGRDKLAQDGALQLGRDMLRATMRREDIAEGLAKAGPAERAAARQGVREFLDDSIANVRQIASDPNIDAREAAKAISELSSKAAREKIAMLLGKPEADSFFRAMAQLQQTMSVKARLARNSASAMRIATNKDIKDMAAPGIVGKAARAEPLNAGREAVRAITGQTDDVIRAREDKLSQEIAGLLTQSRGEEAVKLAQNLVTAMRNRGATDSEIAAAMIQVRPAGAIGGNLGGQAGVSLIAPR